MTPQYADAIRNVLDAAGKWTLYLEEGEHNTQEDLDEIAKIRADIDTAREIFITLDLTDFDDFCRDHEIDINDVPFTFALWLNEKINREEADAP